MKQVISATLVISGVFVMAFFGADSFAQDGCSGGKMHVIQVSPDGNGHAKVSSDVLHVCNGDQIQWVLRGSDREFLIEFLSAAPFVDGQSRGSSNGVVLVNVSAEPGEYDYGISFVGDEPMDPQIIVDP